MLDRSSAKPLHMQMEELIRENLETGTWAPGAPIPSENELTQEYGVSRMTVRGVVTKLVQEGLLFRIPGKGTYVSERKIEAKSLSYEGIREQLERQGYEVSTQLLSVSREKASENIRRRLRLDAASQVYVVRRLRRVRETPLSIHTSYIPVELAPRLEQADLAGEQLCYVLSKSFGLYRQKIVEELESVAATEAEAALLGIKPGHPLLLLQDTVVDAQKTPFEFAQVVFRGDKLKLKLEF